MLDLHKFFQLFLFYCHVLECSGVLVLTKLLRRFLDEDEGDGKTEITIKAITIVGKYFNFYFQLLSKTSNLYYVSLLKLKVTC